MRVRVNVLQRGLLSVQTAAAAIFLSVSEQRNECWVAVWESTEASLRLIQHGWWLMNSQGGLAFLIKGETLSLLHMLIGEGIVTVQAGLEADLEG